MGLFGWLFGNTKSSSCTTQREAQVPDRISNDRAEDDNEVSAIDASKTQCAECGKNIGLGWHYRFESIALAATVAAQCPQCGRITCEKDLSSGPEGNFPPCRSCGVALEVLSDGPAYLSLVERAEREGRYRGAIQSPAALGRECREVQSHTIHPLVQTLLEAIMPNDIGKVEAILQRAGDAKATIINGMNRFGGVPIIHACDEGNLAIINLFLVNGADVRTRNDEGGTALHRAAYRGHRPVIDLLLKLGAEVNAETTDGETPLLSMLSNSQIIDDERFRIVEVLVAAGAAINVRNKHGFTPLFWAAMRGPSRLVEFILAQGADVNCATVQGDTPLKVACSKEIAQLLMAQGARDHGRAKDG